MQVNKYIPHFQRIPTKLGQRDLKMFQEDYNLGNIENDVERERLRKIQHYIIGFDRILIDSLIVDRQVKFQNALQQRAHDSNTLQESLEDDDNKRYRPRRGDNAKKDGMSPVIK